MAGTEAGLALKDEAIDHLHLRQWKDAIRVALAAQRLRPTDVDLHAILAVATAYTRKHDLNRSAVRSLQLISKDKHRSDLDRADSLIALSAVRLAQGRLTEADSEARKALAFDSTHEGAWWHLTATFAGLGWFEQAAECLPLASGRGAAEFGAQETTATQDPKDQSIKGVQTTMPFAEWQVGRAVNNWALSKTPTWIVAILGFFLFGFLGLALAASTPFIAREVRVMRLDTPWKTMAEQAWRGEYKLRLTHALVALSMVLLWIASVTFTSQG